MGLFDTIHCEIDLPDVDIKNIPFQTKDLGCRLDTYTIFRDKKIKKQVMSQIIDGVQTYTYEDFKYTGVITFQTRVRQNWYNFVVTFIDGLLTDIRRLE